MAAPLLKEDKDPGDDVDFRETDHRTRHWKDLKISEANQ